jgi:CheY-like chemotaxis protein
VALALLADRDADTRMMYGEYLGAAGYEIDEAEDGREALAKAITYRPSVIVTEIRLLGMSGIDLCTLLRSDPLTRPIPIFVVTADAFAQDITSAETAGADAVLVKPCLPERLASEIERVLAQSHALRARGRAASQTFSVQRATSNELIARSQRSGARVRMSHSHQRCDTMSPPLTPPMLVCPNCDRPLRYVKSHIGGVSNSNPEQWDYFECPNGCGAFQHRQRTRKLRRVS